MSMTKLIISAALASVILWTSGCGTLKTAQRVEPPRRGLADTHNHQFAYLGFGGLVVAGEAYGPESVALSTDKDLDRHGVLHLGDPLSLLDGPEAGLFSNAGYPSYEGWPRWSSIDHQQVWEGWLKQAHDDGLDLMSMLAVSNEVVCKLLLERKGLPPRDCSDNTAVERQLAEARKMEKQVDWYRIALSAQDARRIIADHKLAVVLGVEVSDLFGCDKGTCTEADVDREVKNYYDLGVRQVLIVHEFDNDFAGAAMFRNALNFGNYQARQKRYFEAVDCSGDDFTYKFKPTIGDLFFKLYTGTDILNPPPKYPGVADCNCRGLTPLGEYLVQRLMDRHMIIDVDHMSNRATNRTLELAEARHYPLISSHGTFLKATKRTAIDNEQNEFHKTEKQLRRIRDLGGVVAPILQTFKKEQTLEGGSVPLDCDYCSEEWAQRYLYLVKLLSEGGHTPAGIPFGSDFNGVIHHVAPRPAKACCCATPEAQAKPVGPDQKAATTAATSSDCSDGTVSTNAAGTAQAKAWAFGKDGFAHIGLLSGFIDELKEIGLKQSDLTPLYNGAEAYVQMWERAESAH